MANFKCNRNVVRANNEVKYQFTNSQYFAAALAEFYDNKAQHATLLLGLSEEIDVGSRIAYMNADGIGRYIQMDDLINNLYKTNAVIKCYQSPTSTEFSDIKSEVILSELIDTQISAIGFSRIFAAISEKPSDVEIVSSEIIQDISVYTRASSFGPEVNSLLQQINGLTPDIALGTLIQSSPEPEDLDDFSVQNYDGNGQNIVKSACLSIVQDVTAGIAACFKNIRRIKDLGKAIVKGITTLVGNLVSIAFADLLNDYTVNKKGVVSGMDLPFASYYWNSLGSFASFLHSHINAPNLNQWTNLIDRQYYTLEYRDSATGDVVDRGLPLMGNTLSTIYTAEIVDQLLNILTTTKFFETMVFGIRVRIYQSSSGKVNVLLYSTGYVIASKHQVKIAAVGETGYTDDTPYSITDSYGRLGSSSSSIKNEDILNYIVRPNSSVAGIYYAPIFPRGFEYSDFSYLDFDVSAPSSSYSSVFYGNPVSGDVDTIVRSMTVCQYHVPDTYIDNATSTDLVTLRSPVTLGLRFLIFALHYSLVPEGVTGVITPVSVSITNNHGDSLEYVSTRYDIAPDGTISPNYIQDSSFYPYYTNRTCDPKIHAQTYTERVSEVRSAIIKLIIAAAASVATVKFFKLRKKVRTIMVEKQALLQQAQLHFNPNDPQTVLDLQNASKDVKKMGRVARLLGVSTTGAAVANPEIDDYDDEFKAQTKLISGI